MYKRGRHIAKIVTGTKVLDLSPNIFVIFYAALRDLELSYPVICNSHTLDNFDREIPYFPRQDEERYFGFILTCQV
jgi:hypothetical protein